MIRHNRVWLAFAIVAVCAASVLGAEKKLFGVCYGPYRDGESPHNDLVPLPSALEEDLAFAQKVANAVRTYSVANTQYLIPEICEKVGIDCYPGAWIGTSLPQNDLEIELLIRIANKNSERVNMVIVGNEVLHRKDLPEEQLIAYVRRVKSAVKVPVAVADTWNSWKEHPRLAKEVDCVMVQIYPYWDGIPIGKAAEYTMSRVDDVKGAVPPRSRIILSEFGWPSAGDARVGVVPSGENQARYFREIIPLLEENSIGYFYFELFDEKWKAGDEGSVGQNWGLVHSNGAAKKHLKDLLPREADGLTRPPRTLVD